MSEALQINLHWKSRINCLIFLGGLQDSKGSGVGSDQLYKWGHCGAGGPFGAEWGPGSDNQLAAGQRLQSHSGHTGCHQQHLHGEGRNIYKMQMFECVQQNGTNLVL